MEKTHAKDEDAFSPPKSRDWETVLAHLVDQLSRRGIPLKRVRFQLEQDPRVQALKEGWQEESDSWPELVQAGRRAIAEVLPACVQCGECCRTGSPTLHAEDLELIRTDKILPDAMFTLRRGEPVRSPFDGRLFYLPEECIKLREKANGECIFLEADLCRIWEDRPAQCRAQSCWDPSMAQELSKQPKLNRRDMLKGVEELTKLLDEHDRRCSFESLRKVFDELKESRGKSVDQVIEALAFEDNFRDFMAGRFNLSAETMEFMFGRSFVKMLRLFGFKVEVDPDGTRTLLPDTDQTGR